MTKTLRVILWSFGAVHAAFWFSIAWLVLRAGIVQIAATALFPLAILAWAILLFSLFSVSAKPWRLKLGTLLLITPLGVPLSAGVGYYSRPIAFFFWKPSLENVVLELQANRKSDAWKRVAWNVQFVPAKGKLEEIWFRIGGGVPGYSQWYLWRADDKYPTFGGQVQKRAAHWFEASRS